MLITNLTFVFSSDLRALWVVTVVPHFGYMRYHMTKGMILVDLNESYQNIPKSPHIARKKVVLLWGQKSYFLFFGPNWYLVPGKKKH